MEQRREDVAVELRRQPYQCPQLVKQGRVEDLTQGGYKKKNSSQPN